MRTFSQPAYVSLMSRITDEVWLAFLDIHIDAETYYVVANSKVPVVSNGQEYTPYPFDVLLPTESTESIEQVQITIDNVDRMFVDALRAAVSPLNFTLRFALASQPDVIELELANLESQLVDFDARKITATLSIADVWNAKFPSVGPIYDPSQCPGLF